MSSSLIRRGKGYEASTKRVTRSFQSICKLPAPATAVRTQKLAASSGISSARHVQVPSATTKIISLSCFCTMCWFLHSLLRIMLLQQSLKVLPVMSARCVPHLAVKVLISPVVIHLLVDDIMSMCRTAHQNGNQEILRLAFCFQVQEAHKQGQAYLCCRGCTAKSRSEQFRTPGPWPKPLVPSPNSVASGIPSVPVLTHWLCIGPAPIA